MQRFFDRIKTAVASTYPQGFQPLGTTDAVSAQGPASGVHDTRGVLAVCRAERARKGMALLALAGFLGGQTLFPVMAVAQTARRGPALSGSTAKPVQSTVGQRNFAEKPDALRLAQKAKLAPGNATRLAQAQGKPARGPIKASEPSGCGDDCDVAMTGLDLSRPPSEKELREAGQLSGALSPIGSADYDRLAQKSDAELKAAGIAAGLEAQAPLQTPAGKLLKMHKDRVQRLKDANLTFGQAMQEWNKHNFRRSTQIFKEHVKAFSDSPWSGEAVLHLGDDAKYSGRYSEAQEKYLSVLQGTSAEPGSPSAEIHRKTKLRLADLDISLGKMDSARVKLQDITATETNWRRLTWAKHWLRYTKIYKNSIRDLRACGTQAVSVVMASLGQSAGSARLAEMKPVREAGFSIAELEVISRENGLPMKGFRARAEQLAGLPTPFIIHYDFNEKKARPGVAVTAKSAAGRGLAAAATLRSVSSVKADTGPFHLDENAGHFLIVEAVDATRKQVQVYDPQPERRYTLSFEELGREWSGTGLYALSRTGRQADTVAKAHLPLVAALSQQEKNRIIGGCCCSLRDLLNMGLDWALGPRMVGCKYGSPAVAVNRINMNMFIEDAPIWYETAVGPDVEVTMSYNSQEANIQLSSFGNKWMLNYASYLIEAPADENERGTVSIFNADGSQSLYHPDPNDTSSYISSSGDYDKLRRISATRYELVSQTGEAMVYDVPAGTGSYQTFLVELRDRWGYSVKMSHERQGSGIYLTAVTDALGQITRFRYDAEGHLIRVEDPFGRHASFAYDTNNNMVETVDMEGNGFQFTYDSEVRVNRINTAQGPWQFRHDELPAARSSRYYITIIDPLGGEELYGWDEDTIYLPRLHHVDQRGLRTEYISGIAGGNGARLLSISMADPDKPGRAYVQNLEYTPEGHVDAVESKVTETAGAVTTVLSSQDVRYLYNSQGNVTAVTDAKGQTSRYYYAANGVDLTSFVDAAGRTVATLGGYDHHQPTTMTEAPNDAAINATTEITYTAWGAPATVTDALDRVTTYNYNSTTKRLTSVARGAVALGSYTYDEVGRLASATDANAVSVAYMYNDLNQPIRATYADGTYEETDYACCGQVSSSRDRSGGRTYYDYDPLKRLVRVQDAAANTAVLEYDAAGNRTAIVDSKGVRTQWSYDLMGRLASKTYADGNGEKYTYDEINNRIDVVDARGDVTSRFFDNNGNVTRIDYPVSSDERFTYNALDQLVSMTDATGTSAFTYDTLGRVTVADAAGSDNDVQYSYNKLGGRSQLRVNSTDTQTYAYDALDRLDWITSVASGAGNFDWVYSSTKPGLLTEVNLPNGTKAEFSYDSAFNRLASVTNRKDSSNLISQYSYGYDGTTHREGRQYADKKIGAGTTQRVNYVYDDVDQLSSEISNEATPQLRQGYWYDAMGNRTGNTKDGGSTQVGGASTTFTANALNQVTGITHSINSGGTVTSVAQTVSYDSRGNMTSHMTPSAPTTSEYPTYSYDDANRLTKILWRLNDPSLTGTNSYTRQSEFLYDAFSRRVRTIEKDWAVPGGGGDKVATTQSDTRYIYDGMEVVQERDTVTNVIQVKYTWAGNIGGLLARTVVNSGVSSHFYYHYDGSGNVTQLTDINKAVQASYTYDAYGVMIGSGAGSQSGQPYAYSTKRRVTGTGLYDYGYRFYSPGLGQWINRDPIEEDGGLNLYEFVGNNPTNFYDSYGEQGGALGPLDTDGDGQPDYLDDDDDRDNIPDAAENAGAGGGGGGWRGNSSGNSGKGSAKPSNNVKPNMGSSRAPRSCPVKLSGPKFPQLKDHANRHGEGAHTNAYYNAAVRNIQQGKRFTVRHNGTTKRVYLQRLGPNTYRFTSTNKNGSVIHTHLNVPHSYLGSKGITLPKGF